MNKKIKIAVTVAIAVVIIFICTIFIILNNKKQNLTNNLYTKMIEKNEYSFTMQNDNNYKTIISKKQENVSIDMYGEDYHTTTLTKKDGTYVLMHDEKEYSVYNAEDMGEDILTDELYSLKGKEYITGKEKIKNQTYKYEEYIGFSAFMTTVNRELDEECIKTRFYFDKDNNLVYIKTITEDEEELLETQVTFTVDDTIFEIPADYAEL